MKCVFYRIRQIFFVVVVVSLFLVYNILFYKYMVTAAETRQSGETYIDREKYMFTPKFSDDSDYVTQHFYPTGRYLKSVKIRLGVDAVLEDKFVVRIELVKDEEVLCQEDVVLCNENNWRYYEFRTEQYVTPGKEYIIRVRQIEGPYKEAASDQYQYSYTVFVATEHIEENATQYYFNGDPLDGELEICYVYRMLNEELLIKWIDTNLLAAVTLFLVLWFRKSASSGIRHSVMWILWGIFPIVVYLICEYALGNLCSIRLQNHILNIMIYSSIYAVIVLIVHNLGMVFLFYSTAMLVITLVQYFVALFRGRPLYIHDILAARTAVTVASSYEFQISDKIFISLMLCLLITCMGALLGQDYSIGKRKRRYGICGVLTGIAIIFMTRSCWLLSVNMWDISATYQTGGNVLTLLSQIPYIFVAAPEGYSVSSVEELAETYTKQESSTDIAPHNIILIMNESFSDLEYINEVQTETTLLPYWKSLKENVIRGYLYVPVFGAGTANSEYEVLTGNSTEFLAQGSTAYQMNVSDNEFGMASVLEEQGYLTTALHPYDAENWNRTNVYNYMGFDNFYASENWGEWEVIRWCVSDQSAYEKVISIDEESSEKQFMFLVTMQNHGGYATEWDNFSNELTLKYEQEYPKAEQYLSLLQESDRAFHQLLEYYENSDERTMIIMFGDHQAAIEDEFYEELYGKKLEALDFEEKQSRYVTPFVIWANYDIEEQVNVEMSANYFGSYILKKAGVRLSAYNNFLLDVMEEIPVIGIGGIKTNEGEWYQWDELLKEDAALINWYKILAYNNVFDRDERVEIIFSIR